MPGLKSFGARIAERNPDRQSAEIQIGVLPINRFNAPGTAESVRGALTRTGKGHSSLRPPYCNNFFASSCRQVRFIHAYRSA